MTLHIYTADKIRRVRRQCPVHKKLELASLHEYYDGPRWFFDCGTQIVDGYYTPPQKYKRLNVFKDDDSWVVWNFATSQRLGRAKTKSGILRIARYHLKSGGKIKVSQAGE
jgi:hypothetical protein